MLTVTGCAGRALFDPPGELQPAPQTGLLSHPGVRAVHFDRGTVVGFVLAEPRSHERPHQSR